MLALPMPRILGPLSSPLVLPCLSLAKLLSVPVTSFVAQQALSEFQRVLPARVMLGPWSCPQVPPQAKPARRALRLSLVVMELP